MLVLTEVEDHHTWRVRTSSYCPLKVEHAGYEVEQLLESPIHFMLAFFLKLSILVHVRRLHSTSLVQTELLHSDSPIPLRYLRWHCWDFLPCIYPCILETEAHPNI